MKPLKNIVRKIETQFDRTKLKTKERFGLFNTVFIYPYRGYGNYQTAWLHGRVLEKEGIIHGDTQLRDSTWQNIKKIWKRYESDEIPYTTVEGEFMGVKTDVKCDGEGYFNLKFEGLDKQHLRNGWHPVNLRIKEIPYKNIELEEETTGEILINDQSSGLGIISDVDDTIIKSNITNPITKMWTMLRYNANTRVAFDGVSESYNKLIDNYKNPLFFISGSSFNLYDMLVSFCKHKNIPKAPFLLRDLGIDVNQWIKQPTIAYKKEYINSLLSALPKLSFICIGDSGQKDPEIYADMHRDHPGRIKAIYIRDVHTPKRREEVKKKARELDIPLLLINDSNKIVEHLKQNA